MDVMVNPTRKNGFHRAVRNTKGERGEMLIFSVGDVVSLTGKKLDAVQRDLRKGALVEVEADGRGKWRPKVPPGRETMEVTLEEYEQTIADAKAEGKREAIAAGSNGNGPDATG